MTGIIESLKTYLQKTLGMIIEVHPYENQGDFPFFLINTYAFFETLLFKHPCLLMINMESTAVTPGMIHKHWEQVEKLCEGYIVIYVQSALPSFNRLRLIEQHLPFVIPGNQMYLPHFGIDLREHFRKIHTKKLTSFSPATQTLIIYALLRETNEKLTPTALAKRLGYTAMTMTRAFHELKDLEISGFIQTAREQYWDFSNKRHLWDQAKPFLRSPIKTEVWVGNHQFKTLAGLSALSHFSEITPPPQPVFAVGHNEWIELKQTGLEVLPFSEGASAELEIWSYNPELFAKDGIIDPFSLFLCLESTGNERIESALEDMLEKIKW